MKRIRIAVLVHVALLGGVVTLDAQIRSKFEPSGSGDASIARYKLLTTGDIRILQNAGHDIHDLKGERKQVNTIFTKTQLVTST